MTTIAWPITGTDYTHAEYREAMAGTDGIVDDLSGDSFHLTLPGTGDNVTINVGTNSKLRLRGYLLQVTADHTLSVPAVASGGTPKTYVIGAKYDPTLESDSGGPVTLFALQKGTYTATGGVAYLALYELTRGPSQVISAATVVDQRAWVGGDYYGPAAAAAVNAWPLGARLRTPDGVERLRVPLIVSGVVTGTQWQQLNVPTWSNLALGSGLTLQGTQPAYAKVANEVLIRGGVARSNGAQLSAGNASLTIATLPTGFRPGVMMRWAVASSYGGTAVNGRVQIETSGLITFVTPFDGGTFASLDGIRFFAEG